MVKKFELARADVSVTRVLTSANAFWTWDWFGLRAGPSCEVGDDDDGEEARKAEALLRQFNESEIMFLMAE
ncbi:hypothetical protein L3X38_026999 [Prunus dulcis]|uniref:Uncharacterized protein n=1 Tax=Prunus dulcis TaxID=3755 RepID=A0AAD4VM81_PRUDU|nr:hypothetical protein L3X38_026999 [Prunus dulcis]